jgi:hypothetical protein
MVHYYIPGFDCFLCEEWNNTQPPLIICEKYICHICSFSNRTSTSGDEYLQLKVEEKLLVNL